MAVRYLRSTTGSDANGGTTWALAKATLAGIDAIDTAGDVIFVSQVHSESTAAAVSFNLAGVDTNPSRLLCGNDANQPPTALATTAAIATTGNFNIAIGNFGNTSLYVYGITFTAGNSTGTATINTNGRLAFDHCNFVLGGTGASSAINNSGSSSNLVEFDNCGLKFGAAAQGLTCATANKLRFRGGSILAGGVTPTALCTSLGPGSDIQFSGFDFSNASAGMHMASFSSGGISFKLRDCKLPAAWTGSLHNSTPANGSVLEMFNCDSADTHYRYRRQTTNGSIVDETTLVRTGGASDGTTTYSYKVASIARAIYPHLTMDMPEIVKWNASVGSPLTATVEVLHDSLTALTDADIWLEVMYLGTSGVPLATFSSDITANVLAAAAAQTASTATWTTTGLTNPNKQKLEVTFTPQEEGFLVCTVKLAKASYTVYVDPLVTVA